MRCLCRKRDGRGAGQDEVQFLPIGARASQDAPGRLPRIRFVLAKAPLLLIPLFLLFGVALWHSNASQKLEHIDDMASHAMQAFETMGCASGELPQIVQATPGGEHTQIQVLTYNLFWWNLFGVRGGNQGSASKLIAASGTYDLMGFQECEDPARVFQEAGLYSEYGLFSGDGSKTSAICMAYLKRNWQLLGQGLVYVAKDHLGKRAAQWMRLLQIHTGHTVFFMNHHGPIPVNSGGDCGGAATAYNLLLTVQTHSLPGDAIIIVGDFNANSASITIQHLAWRLNKDFNGMMCGGIDNVFSNLDLESVVSTSNLGDGGSDHDALQVVFQIGKKRPWWWPYPMPLTWL